MALAFADVPTMLAMIVLSSVVMAGGMAAVGGGQRDDGVRLWALGLMLNALAHLLFALRGHIPDVLSIAGGNALLVGVYLSLLGAVLRFQGRALQRRVAWALPLLMAGCMALLSGSYGARVVVAGLMLLALNLWLLGSLYAGRRAWLGRGAWLVVGALVFQTLVLLLRVGVVGVSPLAGAELLQASAVQTLTFMSTFGVVVLASLGFVFMARDRADEGNRRMAGVDSLTGVANRRAVIAALDRDVARSIRTREPIAVMMVDIDHFKQVNDRYGHPVGDQVLCGVVNVLRERVRSQDLVGRYGGEEFMVVLPDTSLKGAYVLALQLCEAVEAFSAVHAGQEIPVTISIGVFGGTLLPGDHWDMLISAADRALYNAKHQGRNRVEVNDMLRRPASQAAAASGPETQPGLF
jgi:diguanylate cyclase (GGDEF)-like protein